MRAPESTVLNPDELAPISGPANTRVSSVVSRSLLQLNYALCKTIRISSYPSEAWASNIKRWKGRKKEHTWPSILLPTSPTPTFPPYLKAYGFLASLAPSESAEHILTPLAPQSSFTETNARAQEVIKRQRSKGLDEILVPVGRENELVRGDKSIEFVL